MKIPIKESQIQKQVLDYLRLRKIFCFKLNNTGVYKKATGSYIPSGIIGLPDIIAFIRNEVVFLEIKTEKGKLSDGQKAFQAQCEKNRIEYHVIRCLEDAMRLVE